MLADVGDSFAQAATSGSLLAAVPVALLAGLVSFASPCVLPLVPAYVGYLGGMSAASAPGGRRAPRVRAVAPAPGGGTLDLAGALPAQPALTRPAAAGSPAAPDAAPSRGRVVLGVLLFVAGFTAVFLAYGSLAGSLGSFLLRWQDPVSRVLGVGVIVMGLAFLGLVPFLERDSRRVLAPRAGLWGAPVLGVTFGIGWTPCIGPTLAAILLLSLDGGSAGRGALLALAFCVGLGLPFVLVALGLQRSRRALDWLARHRLAVMRVGGGLLLLLGAALVTGLWSAWAGWLQGLLTGAEPFVPAV
ncbi:cytochrome c biogenesis protein CcdA [Cellulomonas sp. ACRRI]|uniref:cytochrome c biogenesis CcdA family protein n=1 Tax=Cellulomonas sp. ACRRI TaxID=2918188 RepID=UPI001EF37935|nr:cytochrome c biogenesis protein CcdA [Cellulomonas sp. ACRRI]MCG7286835.1 cytochrome c biogenesis protein CcdA [Cellulomonas sp. ACRRI]